MLHSSLTITAKVIVPFLNKYITKHCSIAWIFCSGDLFCSAPDVRAIAFVFIIVKLVVENMILEFYKVMIIHHTEALQCHLCVFRQYVFSSIHPIDSLLFSMNHILRKVHIFWNVAQIYYQNDLCVVHDFEVAWFSFFIHLRQEFFFCRI